MYKNITKPLPLRVIGGTINNLNQWQRNSLKTRRNPTPHNGFAKDLFASDLLAVTKNRLSNPTEEKEKELSEIQKNEIKELIIKSKGNPDEIRKRIEKEFGFKFVD